jgi:hypothetical protein
MKKNIYCISVIATAIWSFLLLPSCRSEQQSAPSSPGNAAVALYFTDDASTYKQVIATVRSARLIDSGTQKSCDLLTKPINVDIAKLADSNLLANGVSCDAGSYNRLSLEFAQDVQLMDKDAVASPCRFTSYLDGSNNRTALPCDPNSMNCILDMPAAVRRGALDIVPGNNRLALDFDLKDFVVENFGDPAACSVLMKVSLLQEAEIIELGHAEAVAGRMSAHDPAAQTFTLNKGPRALLVFYSGIAAADQPGLDTLLQTAMEESFSVQVSSPHIDLETSTITAEFISVKAKGKISALDQAAETFTLTYKPPNGYFNVSYATPAVVTGSPDTPSTVEVQLYGFDDARRLYLARTVETKGDTIDTEN